MTDEEGLFQVFHVFLERDHNKFETVFSMLHRSR